MNTKQFEYGARRYPTQSKSDLNPLSIFVLSTHHSAHHHEHSAH